MRQAAKLLIVTACMWGLSFFGRAIGQDSSYVVVNAVVYPGDVISRDKVVELTGNISQRSDTVISRLDDVIGKIAVMTIRPNEPIKTTMIRMPALFQMGALVKLHYERQGILIVSTGMALQSGVAGQRVRVRNSESGITINGMVRVDGSVEVD